MPLLLLLTSAAGATVEWTGGTGSWHNPANWSTGVVPGPDDEVLIDDPTTEVTVTVSTGMIAVRSLHCANNLLVSGGTFTASQSVLLFHDASLSGGIFKRTTLVTTNGARLIGLSGVLDAVTVNGELDVPGASGKWVPLTITNGLTLNGTAWVGDPTGAAYGSLGFAGSQTLGGTGTVIFGPDRYNALYLLLPDTTLTLGPGITVRGQNGMVGAGVYPWGGPPEVSVVNEGIIQADVAGGNIALSVPTIRTADLGVVRRAEGRITMPPVVDNREANLQLDASTGSWPLSGTRIIGGTVTTADGARLVMAGDGGVLDGVTINGELDVPGASGKWVPLTVTNGLTLNGTAWVGDPTGAAYGSLGFAGSQTLGGTGTVIFGPDRYNALYLLLPDTTLTLGPGITVRGQNGMVGAGVYPWGGPVQVSTLNQGTILADVAGGTITLTGLSVTNLGVMNAANGGSLVFDLVVPVVVQDPWDMLTEVGDPLTLMIQATGQAPLSFQWWRDGEPLAGATSSQLSFPAVTLAESGTYYCVVTNSLGTATSGSATVTVTDFGLPAGIAGPVIVRVAVPEGSTDSTGTTASHVGVWEVRVPPFPFNTNSGIGNILSSNPSYFCLHDHFYITPFVPYPDRAMVTYEFNRPAIVGIMQLVLHANGVSQIEGFAGDTMETLESVGLVTGSKGIPPPAYAAFREGSTNTFVFPNPRPGKVFVMVVRRTSLNNGYANYQTYLYAPDGRQYLPASSPTQLTPLITSPKQEGTLLAGDTLFFSTRPQAPGEIDHGYRWAFDAERVSSAPQPGFVIFPTPSTNAVTCDLLDADGQSLETDRRSISVVPDEGTAPDLALVSCDVPLTFSPGIPVILHYAVTNLGPGDARGTTWIDAAYLSRDPLLDATDTLIGSTAMAANLPAGSGYTNSVSLTLPVVEEGPYSVILSLDDAWHILEVHQLNNEYSLPVVVGAVTLTANTWVAGQVPKPDAFLYYRVEVSEAQPFVIEIESADGAALNRLYARHGSLPTLATFDYASAGTYAADPTAAIPLARPGTWYILVHAAQRVGDGSFSIRARSVELQIVGVAPTQGTSGQDLTLDVTGLGFTPLTQVSLVRSGGTVYQPDASEFISPERITASFPSNSLPPAIYSVVVARTDGTSSTVPNSLTIAANGSPNFEANLIVPGEVGRNTVASLYLEYANTGNAAMPAPLLVLQGSQNARLTINPGRVVQDFWTCGNPSDAKDVVQIMAQGQTPGMLQPGERIRVPVNYLGLTGGGDLSQSTVQFSVGLVREEVRMGGGGPIPPIDWDSIKDPMRPSNIPTDAWEALWQNFVQEAGPTWGSYQAMLRDNAMYLGRIGAGSFMGPPMLNGLQFVGQRSVPAEHAGTMLAFEFAQADGLHIARFLASSTDGFTPTPGLRLSFERVFPNRITGRYVLGALGRGWSHNWGTWLEVAADNTVTIANSSGSRRTFKLDCRGGYFNDPGDYATLTALGGGAFSLREKGGLLRAFRPDGRLDYVQDPNNNRITCGYNGGMLTSLTHSSGQSLQLAYTGGFISTITDPVGRQTVFTYAGDHLASAQHFDGSVVRYGYSSGQGITREHALTEIEYPGGTHEFFGYDARGRLASMSRDGGADAVSFSFDTAGQVNATDALGNTSKLFLDQHGLVAKVENPQGSTVRLNYDDKFSLAGITDPAGRSHTYSYDAKGNLIESTDSLGGRTRFSYDGPFQRLGTLLDAKANPTRYSHDAQGNLTAITYANNTVERWAYDASGNPTIWTNRRADAIQYVFNPTNGQLAAKLYPDGSSATYEYDGRGNLAAASNYTGRITLDYYPDDRLRRITYPGDRWLQYTYNAAGQRASMTDQLGYRLDYAYDSVGRLRSMTNSAGTRLVLYEYDTAGRLARKILGNGVYTTYNYDRTGQLLTLTNAKPDSAALSFFNYTYDNRGRRTAMATHYGTWTYGYDDLGQLTRAALTSTSTNVPNQDLTYVYDALGNRIRTIENGVTTEYTVNNMNQYVQGGGIQMNYDADGSLTRKQADAASVLAVTNTFENRVAGYSSTNGQRQFAYDALGFPSVVVRDGVLNHQVHDPARLGDLVGVYDTSGGLLERQNHAFGTIATTDATGQSYLTFDGIGNGTEATDAAAAVTGSQMCRPFGEYIHPRNGTPPELGFGGELGVVQEGDLVYMRARFYDAKAGRFVSSDPIGLLGGDVCLYRYVGNCPLTYTDPTGMWWDLFRKIKDLTDAKNAYYSDVLNEDLQREMQRRGRDVENAGKKQLGDWSQGFFMQGPLAVGAHLAGVGGALLSAIKEASEVAQVLLAYELAKPDPQRIEFDPDLLDDLAGAVADAIGGGIAQIQRSRDPNDVVGPGGFGPQNYIASGSLLPYRINFENATNATAPAQQVVVGNPLSTNLDWATLELTEISFGDHLITVPPNTQHFEKTEKLQVNGFDFEVQIEAGIRLDTGEVYARFQSINPTNGLPPPVAVGFLPPEDGTGRGQGHISYVIRPKIGVPTGTEIRNVATITFDGLETIRTDQVDPHDPAAGYDTNKQALATIDADAPASSVVAGDGTLLQDGWVTWSGSDGGAGVAAYDIYVAEDRGPWTLWLSAVAATSAQFHGTVGKTYSFYSVARDHTGQVEAAPPQGDVSLPLVNALILTAELSGDTLTISFPTETAGHYRLEGTGEVAAGSWEPEAGLEDILGTGALVEVTRTVESGRQRYYRAVRLVGP